MSDANDPILQFFAFSHLPPRLQAISQPFAFMAHWLVIATPRNAERSTALRKLLESKDCAVRAFLSQDGASQPVPSIGDIITSAQAYGHNMHQILSAIAGAQESQSEQLTAILKQGARIMATFQDVIAKVAEQKSMIAGLVAYNQGLRDQIANQVHGLTPEQQATLDGVFNDLSADNEAIATAMVANTPAAGSGPAA